MWIYLLTLAPFIAYGAARLLERKPHAERPFSPRFTIITAKDKAQAALTRRIDTIPELFARVREANLSTESLRQSKAIEEATKARAERLYRSDVRLAAASEFGIVLDRSELVALGMLAAEVSKDIREKRAAYDRDLLTMFQASAKNLLPTGNLDRRTAGALRFFLPDSPLYADLPTDQRAQSEQRLIELGEPVRLTVEPLIPWIPPRIVEGISTLADLERAEAVAREVEREVRAKGTKHERSIVEVFQRLALLPVTGIYDPETAGAVRFFLGGHAHPALTGTVDFVFYKPPEVISEPEEGAQVSGLFGAIWSVAKTAGKVAAFAVGGIPALTAAVVADRVAVPLAEAFLYAVPAIVSAEARRVFISKLGEVGDQAVLAAKDVVMNDLTAVLVYATSAVLVWVPAVGPALAGGVVMLYGASRTALSVIDRCLRTPVAEGRSVKAAYGEGCIGQAMEDAARHGQLASLAQLGFQGSQGAHAAQEFIAQAAENPGAFVDQMGSAFEQTVFNAYTHFERRFQTETERAKERLSEVERETVKKMTEYERYKLSVIEKTRFSEAN